MKYCAVITLLKCTKIIVSIIKHRFISLYKKIVTDKIWNNCAYDLFLLNDIINIHIKICILLIYKISPKEQKKHLKKLVYKKEQLLLINC